LNRKGGGRPGGEEGSRPSSAAEDPSGASVEEAAHEPGGSAREGGRVAGALSMAEMEATAAGRRTQAWSSGDLAWLCCRRPAASTPQVLLPAPFQATAAPPNARSGKKFHKLRLETENRLIESKENRSNSTIPSERPHDHCLCRAYATSGPPHSAALGLDVTSAIASGALWGRVPPPSPPAKGLASAGCAAAGFGQLRVRCRIDLSRHQIDLRRRRIELCSLQIELHLPSNRGTRPNQGRNHDL
jgi:hypothetical protein